MNAALYGPEPILVSAAQGGPGDGDEEASALLPSL